MFSRALRFLDCLPCFLVLLLSLIGLAAQPGQAQQAADAEIARLTQQLKEGNEQARIAVVIRLTELSGPQVVDLLLLALNDASEEVRWRAASALQMKKAPDALDPLLALLKTGRAEIRPQVVRALMSYQETRVTGILLALLKVESSDVCYQAIMSLQERRDPRILPAFIEASRSTDRSTKRQAVEALGGFPGKDVAQRLIELLQDREVRDAAAGAIQKSFSQYGEREAFRNAIQPLIAMIADENRQARFVAIVTLGRLREPGAVLPLISALQDPDAEVQYRAVWALGQLRDPRAVKPLLALATVAGERLPESITEALSRIGKPAVPVFLEEYQQAQDVNYKRTILRHIKNFTTSEAAGLYMQTLTQEDDVQLRVLAAGALRLCFFPRVEQSLITALKDIDPQVRQSAAQSLQYRRGQAITEALLPLLRDPVRDVRLSAVRSIDGSDDPRVKEALKGLASDPDGEIRLVALNALHSSGENVLPLFFQVLDTADTATRKKLLDTVGIEVYYQADRQGRERILTAYIDWLKDADGNVRQEAVRLLGHFSDPRAIDALIQALKDPKAEVRESAAQWLGEIGDDRAVEPLMQAINDPVEWARSAAKDELGYIGEPRAAPALLAIKNVGDRQDQLRTTKALARLGVTEGLPVPQGFTGEEWAAVAPIFGHSDLSSDELHALARRTPNLIDKLQSYIERNFGGGGDFHRAIGALIDLDPRRANEVASGYYQRQQEPNRGRDYALGILWQLHDPRAIPSMIDQLYTWVNRGGNDYSCANLITELGAYDDPRILPLLKEMYARDEPEIRYAAAGALVRRGDKDVLSFLLMPFDQLTFRETNMAIAALGASGDPQALALLLKQLAAGNPFEIWNLGQALGEWLKANPDDQAAYDWIAPALEKAAAREKQSELLIQLVIPLAERKDPRAIDGLIRMVTANDSTRTPRQPIKYLSQYREERIVDALLQALAKGDQQMREAAATALGAQGDVRAVPELLRAVQEDTTRVRVKAMQALGALKAKEAIDPLIAVLQEPGMRVKVAAVEALKTITGQNFGEDAARWKAWRLDK
ncbi:MAG: HEAT repeat domain-containing protein [Armatimonadota bacterium]